MSREEALGDFTLTRRGTSQLALLDDEQYERGVQRIRALTSVRHTARSFRVDLRLFGTTGCKR